jgi:hypothetical protein
MSVNNILSFELYQEDDNYKYYDIRLSAFTGPFVSPDGFVYTGHTQNFTSSWPEIVPTSYSSESVCIQSIRLSTTFNQTNTTLIYDRSDITSENTKEWDGSSWISKPNLLSATTAPYRLYWNGSNIRLSEYKSPPRPTSDTPWEFLTGTRSENLQDKVLFSIRVDNTVSLTSTNVLYNITLFGSHLSTGISGERHWGPINSDDTNGFIEISSVPDQIQVNIVENINNSPEFLSQPNIYGRIDQLYRYNIKVTDQDQDQEQKNITETTQYSIIRNGEINVLEFGLIPNAEHLINSNFDSSQIDYDFIVSGVNHYSDSRMNYSSLSSNKNYFYHVVSENGISVNYQYGDIGWVWGTRDKYMVDSNNFSQRFEDWGTENNVSNVINYYNYKHRAGFILDFEKHNTSASVNKVSYFIKDARTDTGRYDGAWDIWGVNRDGQATLINTTYWGVLHSGHHLIEFSNSNYYSKYVFVANETTNITIDTRMMFTKFNAFGETTKSEPLTINSSSLPAWLTLTDNGDNTGILEGTPSANELDSTINLQVTDNQEVVVQQSFDIRIVPTDFPMISTEPITSVNKYFTYNYTIEVTEYHPDVSGDTIPGTNIPQQIISSNTLPSWLTLTDNGDNTAILSGTPTKNDIGIHSVIIESNDATNLIPLLQTFDINVVNNTTIDLLVSTENGIEFNESIVSGTEFTHIFSDPLHFVYNGTHYNPGTTYATIPAAETYNGYKSMKFQFVIPSTELQNNNNDSINFYSGNSTSDVMLYFMLNAKLDNHNNGSFWTFNANQLDFYYRANNQDNKLTGMWNDEWNSVITHKFSSNLNLVVNFYINFDYLNSELQSYMEIVASSGSYSYTVGAQHTVDITTLDPPLEAMGFYQLRPGGFSRETSLNLNNSVGPDVGTNLYGIANYNTLPVISSSPNKGVIENETYIYNIVVNDAEDTCTITATTLPSWLTLTDNGDNTAILTGTPTENETGSSYSVTLNVNDRKGGLVNQQFFVNVFDSSNLLIVTENGIEFNGSIVSGTQFTNSLDNIDFSNNNTFSISQSSGQKYLSSNDFSRQLGYKSIKFSWSVPSDVLSNTTEDYIQFYSGNSTSDVMLYFMLDVQLDNNGSFWTFNANQLDFYYRANNQDNKLTGRWNNDWNSLITHKFSSNLDLVVNFYINFDNLNSELKSSMEIIASSGSYSYTVGANHTVDITTLDPPLEAEGLYQPTSGSNPTFYAIRNSNVPFDIPLELYFIENINGPPSFVTTPILSILQDYLYTYNITITDAENHISTITATTLPSWLTLTDNGDNTAILSGTPTENEVGLHEVILSSDDNNGGIKTQSFSINVSSTLNLIHENKNGHISINGNLSMIPTSKVKKLPKIRLAIKINTNYDDNVHRIDGVWALKFKRKLVEILGGNYTIDHIIINSITSGSVNVDYSISVPEEDIVETNFDLNNTATTIEANLVNESTNGNLTVDGHSTDASSIITLEILPQSDTDILDLDFSENQLLGNADNSLTIPYSTLISNPGGFNAMKFQFILPSSVLSTTTEDIVFFSKNTNSDFLLDFVLEASLVYSDTSWSFSANAWNSLITFNLYTDAQQQLNKLTENLSYNFSKNLDLEFNFIMYYENNKLDLAIEIISTDNTGNSITNGDTISVDIGTLDPPLTATGFYQLRDGRSADLNVYLQNSVNINTEIKVYGMGNIVDNPVFVGSPITQVNEDSLYTYNITVTDDTLIDIIELRSVTLPSWLSLTDNGNNTGVLSGTPLQNHIGQNRVIIEGVQASGLRTRQDFIINVQNVNDSPEFSSSPILVATEDSLYTYNIIVSDEDQDTLVITAATLPAWLTLTDNGNNTATLMGISRQVDVGDNIVKLIATDPFNVTREQNFTINVENVNDNPVFVSSPILTTVEDNVYYYNITVTDEDGDNVTITASTLPSWLTLIDNGNNTGLLSGTPLQNDVGINSVVLVGTDTNNAITNLNFDINVLNTNDQPVFTSSPILVATEDSVYTYNITVTDEDGDNVTITPSNLPAWLTLTDNGDNTAILSGTPLQNDIGNHAITIFATDSGNGISNQNFNLSVSGVNDSPIFTSSPVLLADEDSVYTYNISVSDEDGDNVTISYSTLPSWLTLTDNGDNTAILSATPLQNDIGEHSVVIVASDTSGGISTQDFTIVVASVNDLPIFTTSAPTSGKKFDLYNYNITITDEENEDVSITALVLPKWLTITDYGNNTGKLSGIPLGSNIGNNEVILVATDTAGGVTYSQFTIVVSEADTPTQPVILDNVVSTRSQLNLIGEDGSSITLNSSLTESTLISSSKIKFEVPSLDITSGSESVENVVHNIILNKNNLSQEITDRIAGDNIVKNYLDQEITNRQNALSAEETARTTAIATLQTNLNNEANARSAADTALEGVINTEITNRTNADTTLTNNLNQEILDRQNAITTEENLRISAINTLQQNIDNLENSTNTDRSSDKNDLQLQINTERSRIDAIMNLSSEELNTFREIADSYQAADSDLTTLITNLTTEFNALKLVVDTLVTNSN